MERRCRRRSRLSPQLAPPPNLGPEAPLAYALNDPARPSEGEVRLVASLERTKTGAESLKAVEARPERGLLPPVVATPGAGASSPFWSSPTPAHLGRLPDANPS